MTQASSYMLYTDAIRKIVSDKISRLKGTDIRARSARGVMALSIGTFAGRGMRFVRSMILARILAPNQIGLMAIIMSFSVAFEALTEVGVKQSIIQNKQGANTSYLNVAWWMQVTRALCLYGIAVLSAPFISSFYGKPELLPLLRVAFLAIALRGFISPRAHVLEKKYKFGRAVFLLQGSAILGTVITVILALVMRNVWALVIGFVIEMAILCILSFILVPFLPRFELDKSSLSELMKFARRMFGLAFLTMLSFQAPNMVLGKVISMDQLGLYTFSALLTFIPIDIFTRTISPVLLPAFSEKQDDKQALCRGLIQTTRLTATFIIPLVAFMSCCAGELLLFAYGSLYVAMTVPLIVLSMNILARSEATILAGIYLAIGQPHLQRRFAIIRAVAIIGLIYPAVARFGPLGAVAVIVFSNFSVLLMQVLKARTVINLELRRYIRCYIPGLLLALPIIMTIGLLRLIEIDLPILVLSIGVSVLIAALIAGAFILNRLK